MHPSFKKILWIGFLFFILIMPNFAKAESSKNLPQHYIIDTDVGDDDVIAMLYLMKHPNIKIDAITIEGDGNAHCGPAFSNIQGVLKLMHQPKIPVACGRATPLKGNHAFPDEILKSCDAMVGAKLDKPNVPQPKITAKELMIKTLQDATNPIAILAIGPLTTIAEVIEQRPDLKNKITRIYFMGGAVNVPGNIKDVDPKSSNTVAEWNVYIDPYAAEKVFHSGIPITLVPLDATNKVLVDTKFLKRLQEKHTTPASVLVYDILSHNKKMIDDNIWFFWDPMAAVAATDPALFTVKTFPLSVLQTPEKLSGQTIVDSKNGAPIQVCTDVQKAIFKDVLFDGITS